VTGQLSFADDGWSTEPPAPPDAAARARIGSDLDATLFVEAGAGAGKTTALVGRVLELLRRGVPITAIAAITFTEKAAADLRHRLRQELSASSADPRLAGALDDLDRAAIGTLHAFARRILVEFPVDAGLPPGFTVLDELESGIAFEERWDDLVGQLLDRTGGAGDDQAADGDAADGALAGGTEFVQLCEFDGFGISKGVRRVAEDFHSNWDLVDARVDLGPPAPLVLDVGELLAEAALVCATAVPEGDDQAVLLRAVAALAGRARSSGNLRERLDAVQEIATCCARPGNKGRVGNWSSLGGRAALDALRDAERALAEHAERVLDSVRDHRRRLLGALLGRFVLETACTRAADGTLEFHDLLVLARRLVANHAGARSLLHSRYARILLDEFQDTDPIQLELAVRLTAEPDDPAQCSDWRSLHPIPGRLFVVGDPKQSIYRFRRADIAQYLRAADQVGADTVALTANFRSAEPVIDWINATFVRLIEHEPDVQPAFQRLDACRPHHLAAGTVRVLGATEHADLGGGAIADELRAREATDVAAAVTTALVERWQVTDARTGTIRDCRPGDITVLLPARTSLPALEQALRAAALPYRAENSSVVYTTIEVRHVLTALRAADDPTDELSLVTALRSPLYGCSDVELFEWRASGGGWSIWADPPPGMEQHAVADAIGHVRTIAVRSASTLPADLLDAVIDERRVLDAALDAPDARDVWRRLRYVVDQARAWSDAGGHGVRRYLAWAQLQAMDGRSADTILPEHDHDAVRVMTIHAAKGLEFPITIVSGLTTEPRPSRSVGVVWPDGTWTLSGKHGDAVYDRFLPLDEQMGDAERRRLLYVACTRAVDHLVVSLHRPPPRDGQASSSMTSAALLASAGAFDPATGALPLSPSDGRLAAAAASTVELPWSDDEAWETERLRALAHASRRTTISATRLAEDLAGVAHGADAGLVKGPVDIELPPWQRGRYGTAIGRAVHGVLQFADLVHGADIDTFAKAQAAAEGVTAMTETVAALARSAIGAPIVHTGARGEHHRELFVAADVDGRVVEGYVDLLVRGPAGYVIVDYKTDQWPDDDTRAVRIGRYRRQLAAYAVALERILGERVVRGVLVRCRLDGAAEEIELDGWRAAIDELAAVVGQRR
jgi:ATP-dependent helicase/nuclease subunit A